MKKSRWLCFILLSQFGCKTTFWQYCYHDKYEFGLSGINIVFLSANGLSSIIFISMNNSSFCILCLSSDALRQQLFVISKVNISTSSQQWNSLLLLLLPLSSNVHVCVSSRVKRWITSTGVCGVDLWIAQSWVTCWRRASTQAAPPAWVMRTPMILTSPQRKRNHQPARASLILSLWVAIIGAAMFLQWPNFT